MTTEDTAVSETMTGDVHKPFTDDGVTYCGWDGNEGCGHVWPCPTVRADGSVDPMIGDDDE